MSKKKNRPHGHYCKICGEYKANEKFSGKGHAVHICKACSRLSVAEKAAAMDMNRLMSFPMRRLSEGEKKWLKAKMKDDCPEVAEMVREVFNVCFPHAERNAMKILREGICGDELKESDKDMPTESEDRPSWRVQVKYSNHTAVSYTHLRAHETF